MDKLLKTLWAVACVVGMVCALWLVFRPASVVVIGNDGKAQQTSQKFGGTTGLDSLALQGSLTVAGATTLTGNISTAGTLNVTGTSTFSGDVIGAASTFYATMSSSATTTACFITPSISRTRVITAVGVIDRGSAVSVGAVNWTAGTSTASGVAPTGTKLINNVLTRVSGVDVISTTSSVQTAYSSVAPGESIIFQTATTTNAGSCYVVLN